MKKYFTLLSSLLLFSGAVNAQVNYSLSSATAAYLPVTGGTTPTLINRPFDYNQSSYTYDEGFANNLPIGFTFNYNGVNYSTINICANGFATLGSPFDEINYVENFYVNSLESGPLRNASNSCSRAPEPGNIKPVLAPLWDDLTLQVNTNLRYITTGSAGNHVFTFEWSDAKWQYNAAGSTISFELKLYEGTNIIEFCYKDEGGTPSALASASIGITASNQAGGGFISLQNTSSSPTASTAVETGDLSQKPANNQVYRFTPLLCMLPLNVHFDRFDNTSVNFSWSVPNGVNNFEYAVDMSQNDPASGTFTTLSNATVSSLSAGTKYYIHVRSYCSASSQSVWSAIPFFTTKNSSPAPTITWQKNFGGSQFEIASSVAQTSDGGYVIAGESNSNDGDVSGVHSTYDAPDYWIVKLNNIGAIEWQKSLGGDYTDFATAIKQTTDGGYIIAGYSNSIDGDVIGNHTIDGQYDDYWIVKLRNNGTIEWTKALGGSSEETASSIEQTSDGGYIIAGTSYSNDGDVSGNHGTGDYWIVKLTASGVIEWQKSIGGIGYDYAESVKQTSDGGYIVAGDSQSSDGDVSGNHGGIDYWIVKLNSLGTIQWQKSLGGSGDEGARSIEQTSDGGYIVGGFSNSSDGDVSNNKGSNDYWIVKINANGVIEWQKNFGGSCDDLAYSIKQTSDAGYIIAGYSGSVDGDIVGNHGGNDYWLIKLSSDGTFQWQKALGGSSTDASNYGSSILQTSDGGYIVAGNSSSNDGDISGNHGNGDYWIIKLGPDGSLPVTLLNFSGEVKGKRNLLHWTTVTEQNNTGFEMQRSTDGTSFSKIGFINTKSSEGNSNGNLNYDFIDENYSASTNYYRLKQIDKDGKFSYSNVVVLKNKNVITSLSIYPNPAKNVLNVKLTSRGNSKVTIVIIDLSGKLLINKVKQVGDGENVVKIDITALHAGTYFIKTISSAGEQKVITKFEKD